MKTKILNIVIASAALLTQVVSGYAQGTFQNLDFESANIPNGTQPGLVLVTNALPGWSVYYGISQMTQIYYNNLSLGSSRVNLVSSNDPSGESAIEGNFGVIMQGGTTAASVSIRQTGLVPDTAESIVFKANLMGPVSLSLGGQNIQFTVIGSGPNYTLYGGNIPPSLAGQMAELQFSVPHDSLTDNVWVLDSIMFSPNIIPEPSTIGVCCIGGLLFGFGYWRRKSD
jgi:hypothetical protein